MNYAELSKKDKDILQELSINARMSLTDLAKKVRLSKQNISYRLKLLEDQNVILGYHAITNSYLIGKTHYRVFVKFQNITNIKEDELVNYILKNSNIIWIANFDGDFDFAYLVWADNVFEFEKIFDDINEKFGQYFLEKYFSIATRIEYLPYNFINDKKIARSIVFGGHYSKYDLDSLDKTILEILNKNGRSTLVEISQNTTSSPKVIRDRINKLIKNNIILGYNIKINHNLLGFTHRKVLLKLNNNSKEFIKQLSTYLRNQKNTIYIIKPIGDFDFEFELMTKTNDEFHNILKELRSKFAENIKSYNTVIHYSEPKSGQLYEF